MSNPTPEDCKDRWDKLEIVEIKFWPKSGDWRWSASGDYCDSYGNASTWAEVVDALDELLEHELANESRQTDE